jgi:hypothetical protein
MQVKNGTKIPKKVKAKKYSASKANRVEKKYEAKN